MAASGPHVHASHPHPVMFLISYVPLHVPHGGHISLLCAPSCAPAHVPRRDRISPMCSFMCPCSCAPRGTKFHPCDPSCASAHVPRGDQMSPVSAPQLDCCFCPPSHVPPPVGKESLYVNLPYLYVRYEYSIIEPGGRVPFPGAIKRVLSP